MKRLQLLFLFFLMLLPAIDALGTGTLETMRFRHYTTEDGLPNNRITHLLTDSRGYLWLCTWQGVSSFDGYTFRNYQPASEENFSKSHSRFVAASEDALGRMWFTSYNRQLYMLDQESGKFLNVLSLLYPGEYGRCSVSEHFHTRQGITWAIIQDKGVVAFVEDRQKNPVKVDMVVSQDYLGSKISASATDAEGRLWVASTDGAVFRISPKEGCETILQGAGRISRILSTKKGTCALGDNWLFLFPATGGHIDLEYSENERGSALAAFRDTLYIGTLSGSVYRYDAQGTRCSLLGRMENAIDDLYTDGRGVLWISSAGPGITRFRQDKGDFKHFEHPRNTSSDRTDEGILIKESAGQTWVKMREYGFGYYDYGNDEIRSFFNDPETSENRMSNGIVTFEPGDKVTWITTYDERGLWRVSSIRPLWKSFTLDEPRQQGSSGEIRALCRDERGDIWVGTKGGELFRYDTDLHRTYTHPRPLGMVYCIKALPGGRLAIGTKGNGFCILHPSEAGGFKEQWFHHSESDPASLSSDQVYCIEQDSRGRLWIGTFGGGINLLQDSDSGTFVHPGNGFPGYPTGAFQRVRWLLSESPDRMIAATVDGLLLFNPQDTPDDIQFTLFTGEEDSSHALPNNDVIHMYQDSGGSIWIATYGGIALAYKTTDGQLTINRASGHPATHAICRSVTEDLQGNIWTATQDQIIRYSRTRGGYYSYYVAEQEDNVVFPETTALSLPNGDVLFGCGRRLFQFHSGDGTAADGEYNLAITGILADGKALPVQEDIRLPRSTDHLQICFAALNLSLQPEIEYSCQLLGTDPEPVFSGQNNSVSYSNRHPGKYCLRIQAFSDRDEEPIEEICFRFRIPYSPWSLFGWLLGAVLACFSAAGFFLLRARRNQPQSSRPAAIEFLPDIVIEDRDAQLMQRLQAWLNENLENDSLSVNDMADAMNLGRTTLYNKIKTLTGKSPVELIKTYRLEAARSFVASGQFSISEVAYKVGFSSPGYFTRCFKEHFHISPTEYQKAASKDEK